MGRIGAIVKSSFVNPRLTYVAVSKNIFLWLLPLLLRGLQVSLVEQ